ncbi:helicase-related protein [Herbidospora mongoliensis]|uniref:helicase-related protein n=1 Tax=Herbidospora mongoliensis TaxID=688067 RepID=UPI00082CA382|nr:helicase-related protein [Herbidospora mongoliensis]
MTQADDVQLLTPGRVVRLRERLWRVDYQDGSVFGATALDGRDNRPTRFHSELEHVESGELPFPDPNAIGDEQQQRLLLDAYRFSLLHGTAPILGLQRSRAIPTDFQIVPLLMALGSDRVRLLIADDVGTGKTVEAGLILSELLARGRARRVLIVVPANLRDQWRDTLDRMFHIDATIVAGHLLPSLERRLLPGQSVWATQDVVIASIDYLKTRTEEVLSHGWDLVLVDEAHLAAQPHTEPGRATPDMERFGFVQEAAARSRHLLLLTATPHNGYTDSYASLFRMLNPALVQDGVHGPRVQRAAAREHHVVQRRRVDIEEWYRERGVPSPFPVRRADEQIVELRRSPDMVALLNELKAYAGDLYDAATGSVDRWVAAHLQKRLLSSPAALRSSIDKRLSALTRGAALDARTTATKLAEETTSDLIFTEDDEADAAHLNASVGLPEEIEVARLRVIADLAKKVTPGKDPKLVALLRLLPERMAAHPRAQRVLVFTKYKDTLDYLVTNLIRAVGKGKNGLPAETRVFEIHGGLNLAQRNEVFAAFERADRAVLVATDCISEGVNLQRACAELVHYELPWNPNRLEQRNGRIDRFQQREPFVGIRTLVLDDPLDASLLYLIVRKSEQMRADYGFVPPFLANTDILLHLSDPDAAYRGRLSARSSSEQLSLVDLFTNEAESDLRDLDEELARMAETSLTETDKLDRVRDESFYGQTRISLTAIEDALNQSRALTGTTEQVRDFTLRCLRDMHADITEEGAMFRLAHPPAPVADLASAGYQFTFDPSIGIDRPEIDVVDLAHPLLRRLIDITLDRAQLPDCHGRVAARTTTAQVGHAAVLHVLFRYVAKAEPPVLLEEIVPIGCRTSENTTFDAEAVMAAPAGSGTRHRDDVLDDATDILHASDLRERLDRVAAQRATELSRRHAQLSAAWAHGLERVEPTSLDLVAVTVIYPEVTR